MGQRGPVPERKANLLGHRSTEELDGETVTRVRIPTRVSVPRSDPNWHPSARRLYEAVKLSGQTKWYEPSDWAMLYSLCEDISEYKFADRRSAMMAQTLYSQLSNLLVTEGDRRRVAMEIDRGPGDEPKTDAADVYKDMLGVS